MAPAPITDLEPEIVKAGLDDGSMLVVDVREATELMAGMIPGSVSMPLSQFDPAALPPGRRIVFSCAGGVRSRTAIEASRRGGLEVSEHLGGGFRAWLADGQPVHIPSDPNDVRQRT